MRLWRRRDTCTRCRGRGSFVAEHTGVDRGRQERLLHTFDQTAAELLYLGLTRDALCTRIANLKGGAAQ